MPGGSLRGQAPKSLGGFRVKGTKAYALKPRHSQTMVVVWNLQCSHLGMHLETRCKLERGFEAHQIIDIQRVRRK